MKRIIGCGNLLLKDEGIGIHLIRYLQDHSKAVSPDVELIDGACGGFDLIPFFEGADKVIIVDAVKAGGSPGDVYKFGPSDFEVSAPPSTSLHDVSLKEVFAIVEKIQGLPPVTIFGVEPKEIGWGMELTQELQAVLPRLAELVTKELTNA